MTKPSFRRINTEDVPDALIDQINDSMGVPTLTRPQPHQQHLSSAPAPKPPPRPKAAASREKLTVVLPGYLMDAMKLEALKRRMTLRHFVILAMQSVGLEVEPQDLVPDARKTGKKPAR